MTVTIIGAKQVNTNTACDNVNLPIYTQLEITNPKKYRFLGFVTIFVLFEIYNLDLNDVRQDSDISIADSNTEKIVNYKILGNLVPLPPLNHEDRTSLGRCLGLYCHL